MQKVFRWIVHHPLISASIAIAVPLVLALGLPRLQIDGSTKALYPVDGEEFVYEREVQENFRGEPAITIVASAPDVFQTQFLESLRSLTASLGEIPGVVGAGSILDIDYPTRDQGVLKLSPLIEETPREPEAIAKARERVLSHRVARGRLVNEDGTAAIVLLTIEKDKVDKRFEKNLLVDIERILASYRSEIGSPITSLYAVGRPVISTSIISNIWHDLVILGPVVLLLMGLFNFLIFRSPGPALLILATGGLSVIGTLGFMGIAGIEMTPLVSVVVILILVIGSMEDVHLLTEYLHGRSLGLGKREALLALGGKVLSALLLTTTATGVSFLTLMISPVPGLRDFAVTCTFGILLNFLITLLLLPAGLAMVTGASTVVVEDGSVLDRISKTLSTGMRRQRGIILLPSLCLAALAWAGASRVVIDNNYLLFFSKESPVRLNHQRFAEEFGASTPTIVTIETGKHGGAIHPDSLRSCARFQDRLEEEFGRVFGMTDFLREFERLRGNEEETRSQGVPETRESIQEFLYFTGEPLLSRYLDFDQSRTAIWIHSPVRGSRRIQAMVARIREIGLETLPADHLVRVTGEPVVTAIVSDSITRELVSDLTMLAVTVTLLIALFSRSLLLGLLALIPNLFPVLITFGVMGWTGIPLSIGTFAVAVIALGISVDDTIHLISRFLTEARAETSVSEGRVVYATIRSEILPILVNWGTLSLGFTILLMSDFQVHRETGLLFLTAISTALVADLTFTPLALLLWKRIVRSRI